MLFLQGRRFQNSMLFVSYRVRWSKICRPFVLGSRGQPPGCQHPLGSRSATLRAAVPSGTQLAVRWMPVYEPLGARGADFRLGSRQMMCRRVVRSWPKSAFVTIRAFEARTYRLVGTEPSMQMDATPNVISRSMIQHDCALRHAATRGTASCDFHSMNV